MKDDIGRYAWEAAARANELLDMMSEEERVILSNWAAIPGNIDLRIIADPASKKTLKILAQTPAQDRRWQEKTPRPQFVREWLAVRNWAIEATRALRIAAELQDVPGMEYRHALQSAAAVAGELLDPADLEDALFLRLDD